MVEKFHKRFGIHLSEEEAQRRFVRILSGVISCDGLFISDEARLRTAEKLDPNMGSRLKKWKPSNRVNSPDVAYAAMVAMSYEHCVKVFRELDDELPKVTVADNETISNIGERITYFRHPVSHGAVGDPSVKDILCADVDYHSLR